MVARVKKKNGDARSRLNTRVRPETLRYVKMAAAANWLSIGEVVDQWLAAQAKAEGWSKR